MEIEGTTVETSHDPIESTVMSHILDDGRLVVGYLSCDPDCPNPLTDCDGMGKIYNHSEDGFEKAMGNCYAVSLDCPNNSKWRRHCSVRDGIDGVWAPDESCIDHIKSKALSLLLPGVNVEYKSKLNPDGTGITRPPKPGEKPYFKDGTCIDERYHNIITLTLPDGSESGGYKTFASAYQAAARKLGVKMSKRAIREKELEVANVCADEALNSYNAWADGDCYGYTVEVFDNGKAIEKEYDACWGLVGSKWAKEELKSNFDSKVERLSRATPEEIALAAAGFEA